MVLGVMLFSLYGVIHMKQNILNFDQPIEFMYKEKGFQSVIISR